MIVKTEDLYRVATDGELVILDALLIRAGYLWRCPLCFYHNPSSVEKCEGCANLSKYNAK